MNARKHRIDTDLEAAVDVWPGRGKAEFLPHLRTVRSRSDSGKGANTSGLVETIMVATDFSEHAAHAVDRVGMLADAVGLAKVTLLHVLEQTRLVPIRQLSNASKSASSRQNENARRQLAKFADQLRHRTGLTVDDQVEAGHVVTTIQCSAAAADLLVLGAQGAHPMRDLAIGSTAERILRNTPVPVLIVRRKAETPYRRVLVAVDFQSDPNGALNYAQALAPGASLNLVHAYHVPFDGKMRYGSAASDVIDFYRAEARATAVRRMGELVSARAPSIPVIVHGNPAPKLLEMERALGVDLIVAIKRKRSFTEALLLESVTSKLLERSQCDVLVVQ